MENINLETDLKYAGFPLSHAAQKGITEQVLEDCRAHAEEVHPKEACGVIVDGKYIRCRNMLDAEDVFEIHYEDLANAMDSGELQGYFHSHTQINHLATEVDLMSIEMHKLPWIIYSTASKQFSYYEPTGYKVPLIGRSHHKIMLDCFALVRDYYERELGIELDDIPRSDQWWTDPNAESLIDHSYERLGFRKIDMQEMHKGDVLVFKEGANALYPNHTAVWLGDADIASERTSAVIGNNLMLHHPYLRTSRRDIFGDYWMARLFYVLRHKDNEK